MSYCLGPVIRAAAAALAAALLCAASPPEEEQAICVGGPKWRPSLADGARIEAEPVPASYRELFESRQPCVRWALEEGSIVDWHSRFGTERSMSSALAYLERDHIRGAPAVNRFRLELERAWRSALPDLRRTSRIEERPELDYSLKHRFMEKSPSIRKFNGLLAVRENYLFLAEQHLRGAEEFDSKPLLAKAELYLRAVVGGTKILEPLESQEPQKGLVHFNLDQFRAEDFEMRAAILRARLSRSERDLAAAERIVQSFERPSYRGLAEAVFSGGDDFCDISDGWDKAEALRAECDDDHATRNRLTNYWINRAALDLVAGHAETGSGELAFRLLERERSGASGRGHYRRSEEDLLRLRLLGAEAHRRRLESHEAVKHDRIQTWQSALAELRQAELLAPVHSSPARFRRIAIAWLDVWNRGETLVKPSEERFSRADSPESWRYAAYLRRLLADVEGIAAGDQPQ